MRPYGGGMTSPKSLHVWMPDGRSLCDLRAQTGTSIGKMTDEEFEAFMVEQESAPACGSCILLAGRIRNLGSVILKESKGAVFPEQPSEAWAQLRTTRWAKEVDLDEFLERPGLNESLKYERIDYKVDPNQIAEYVEDRADHASYLRSYRAQVVSESTDA